MSSESTCLVNGHYKVINGMSPIVRVEDNVLSYRDYRLGEELKIEIQYGKVTTGVHMNVFLKIFFHSLKKLILKLEMSITM